MSISALVAAMCIPSALTGFCFWLLERRIAKREAEQDKKDEARKRNEVIVIRGVNAAMLWLYYATGGIPDTLCTCVFAACGGGCGVMGWIKTTKERQRERGYELEDRAQEKGHEELKVCGCATEAEPEEGEE